MTTQKPFSFAAATVNPFLRPFAPTAVEDEVAADAPEGSYTYKLVQSGPAVPAEECESAVAAVEIMIRWGATVMHVAELTPPRSFYVGEEQPKDAPRTDFVLPMEKLGATRAPVVLVEGSTVKLVLAEGATGTVTFPGAAPKSARDLFAAGEPCAELSGARTVVLPTGARAAIEVGGVSFEISAGNAGKKASRVALKGEALPYTGLSFLLHAGLLAATALFMPSLAMAEEDGISDQQRYDLIQALDAAALREPEQKQDAVKPEDQGPASHGQSGHAGAGEQGKAGSTASRNTNGRFAIEKNGEEQRLSKSEALRQAREFGMIGILQSMEGSVNVPTAPWGAETASGSDDVNKKGNIFGTTIDDAAGSNGLSLSGIGEGGGNNGQGIGVGTIGTVGHDFTNGVGRSTGHLTGRHVAKAPGQMHVGRTDVNGRLPAEVIQRVVRQNFGRFRACYENGLRNNPSLSGRVAVRFVIGHDGDVSNVANGGSDMPDAGVVSCVTRAFYGLSFPHPENGIVTVTYPIVFSPTN